MLSRRINEVKTDFRAKGIIIEDAFVNTAKGVRGIRVCKIATVSTVTTETVDENITKDIEETVDIVDSLTSSFDLYHVLT